MLARLRCCVSICLIVSAFSAFCGCGKLGVEILNGVKFSELKEDLSYHDVRMNASKLIKDHLIEIQSRIVGHTEASLRFRRRDKIIPYWICAKRFKYWCK